MDECSLVSASEEYVCESSALLEGNFMGAVNVGVTSVARKMRIKGVMTIMTCRPNDSFWTDKYLKGSSFEHYGVRR
jgi:hypothetical protein